MENILVQSHFAVEPKAPSDPSREARRVLIDQEEVLAYDIQLVFVEGHQIEPCLAAALALS
jgi:hypothetical protein